MRGLISVNLTVILDRLAQRANPPAYVFMPPRGPRGGKPTPRTRYLIEGALRGSPFVGLPQRLES
jgi:hypothetical protein